MRSLDPSKGPHSVLRRYKVVSEWPPSRTVPGNRVQAPSNALNFSSHPVERVPSYWLPFPLPSCVQALHFSCGVLGSPNSACFGAERSGEPAGNGPASGASLNHTTLPPNPAVLSARSLESSKKPCFHAEEKRSGRDGQTPMQEFLQQPEKQHNTRIQ